MPDWEKIVREKLGRLPLNDGRQEEVIDELAQQLESAYEEAIASGANKPEALRAASRSSATGKSCATKFSDP